MRAHEAVLITKAYGALQDMNTIAVCPICRTHSGQSVKMFITEKDSAGFECDICGKYEISNSAHVGDLDPENSSLSSIERAALSHYIRNSYQGDRWLTIYSDWKTKFGKALRLPSPSAQVVNIIRYLGEEISKTGQAVEVLPVGFQAVVGSLSREFAIQLVKEMRDRNLLRARDVSILYQGEVRDISLSITGWERFEAEKAGRTAGRCGFVAMKFGDPILDPFVKDVVKPAVKTEINYDLVDMRNVAQAGVIDNIMRAQIRDSAFVIVDLTHDNAGAYWEAGYAEGLGKPVIYICQKDKFQQKSTHFDTNHCTTIPWDHLLPDTFRTELVATLRRSLNLFS